MAKPNLAEKHRDCEDCPIRHQAICARCEPSELEVLDQIKFYRDFEPGQIVIWGGDEMDFVASVVTGVATLSHTMEDGRRQMVGLLLPGDFVGRPGRIVAPYDVAATSKVTLCCFNRGPFDKLLTSTPSIGARLLEMTLDELDAAREWMLILGRKTAREKIASLMAKFARRSVRLKKTPPQGPMDFDLPLTREAMADYLSLTLETVSRQLSALKRDGVIHIQGNRHIAVPDFQRLLEETGDDTDGGLLS